AAYLTFRLLPETFTGAEGDALVFSEAGRKTLAVMVWMAIWWLTEAVHVSVTALIPLVAFPLCGAVDIKAASAPYASDTIFLFMGGFMLALSMQRWGLDQRIALFTLRLIGTKPINIIGGCMLITAILSAFVSNTATTAMMLPIGISLVGLVRSKVQASSEDIARFSVCLMLGIAYAASIGGVATIIGSPPNVLLVNFLKDTIATPYQRDISYVKWMQFGVPLVVVFLPLTWMLLTRILYPVRLPPVEGGQVFIRQQYKALGNMKRGELVTMLVFFCTATCWIIRPWLSAQPWLLKHWPAVADLSDPVIAMTGAMLLFVIPVNIKKHEYTLDWNTAAKLPWSILILFGGGLSLAKAVKVNGVAEYFGSQAVQLQGIPPLLIVIAVVTMVIFLTELTSNTATTATLLPILAGIAPALHMHPYLLVFPLAIAASCAFMMPVATPPNAIVFGSGEVTLPQMCKAGIWLNLIGIVLVTALMYAVVLRVIPI
ncbi:MAG: sodium-dependent dicarboxylate transporter 2/3/5, partial [Candidatus Omnitrophota bacterium]